MLTRYKLFYKLIIILSIIGFILPGFSLSQEESKVTAPETLEKVQEFGEKFLKKIVEELPGIIEKIWREDVLPVWQKMYDIWSNWWDFRLQPWLQNIWQKFMTLLGQEVEKRKPQIEETFEKEKEELKEEIKKEAPEVGKSLWDKLKELIK